jgi:hypothetical protein
MGEAFASGFIGEIRVFLRKCFALLGFIARASGVGAGG